MPSTYSDRLRLELIALGEQSGTWGTTTNTNLGTLLEESIAGYVSVTHDDSATDTLTSLNGATDEARNMVVDVVGTLTATRILECPAKEKVYIIRNGTTGGFSITFQPVGGTGLSIPNGATMLVYTDGSTMFTGSTGTLYLDADNDSYWQSTSDDVVSLFMNSKSQAAFTGGATNEGSFTLYNTETDAVVGPLQTLYRNSASPAASDVGGQINFDANSITPTQRTYAFIRQVITTTTDGAEDGTLHLGTIQSGSAVDRFVVGLGLYKAGLSDPGAGMIATTEVHTDYVRDQGDSTNHHVFGTNTQSFVTNGTQRLAVSNNGVGFGSGETVDTIEATITDDDTHIPTSGAVVDYVTANAVPGNNIVTLKGHIWGLTTSNGTDTAHDIDIAVGQAADNTDGTLMVLGSALTKQIDAAWAVGTAAGGLDGTESVGGTPDADTWYHMWLIMRSDTGVVDALFSESATAPTMPTNYDKKRRIGAVLTDGSANIIQYYQNENTFLWNEPPTDYNGNPTTGSAILSALSVPTGVRVEAHFGGRLYYTSHTGSGVVSLYSPDITTTMAVTYLNAYHVNCCGAVGQSFGHTSVWTDTSAQIRIFKNSAFANVLQIATIGWTDGRGRY
jgi:hypothetical protein